VSFVEGDAQALPLSDASVDVAVMALVLFFLPSPLRGLQEMVRAVRPGGMVAAYHWDMAGGGFPLQPVLDAVRAEGHKSQEPPSTWASALDASERLWREAGLVDVQTRQFEVQRHFDGFDDFWRTTQGSPRLRDLYASLAPDALQRLRERVRRALGVGADGPLVLHARSNAVKGRKPRALIAGRHLAGVGTSSERQVLNANAVPGSGRSQPPRAASPTCWRSA
jgi:SAM-dependent methyltransferase